MGPHPRDLNRLIEKVTEPLSATVLVPKKCLNSRSVTECHIYIRGMDLRKKKSQTRMLY